MPYANRVRRRGKAVATASSRDGQLVDILIFSLAGLSAALFQIAHYAGSDVLPLMFAP